ncbi:class I SAM-dependent methyltransferase [Candidatus Uhrbacteria bacterium]|nr:class I SAM-dependent methyltransferase [Candidatus Uhrbacteria bacterium]
MHIPFAFYLIGILQPRLIVELGTHRGDSYCSFLQAVADLGIDTKCYAVDHWTGDQHSGYYGDEVYNELRQYHDKFYSDFSQLLRMTFDEGLQYFSEKSIDFLHIDGEHTYEAVKHDFDLWLPKMSESGVLLLHDTDKKDKNFGVYRLWEKLKKIYPSINFSYGNGLGILFVGTKISYEVINDITKSFPPDFFRALGERVYFKKKHELLNYQLDATTAELQSTTAELHMIERTILWRAARKFYFLVDKLFPSNTRRRQWYSLMVERIKGGRGEHNLI